MASNQNNSAVELLVLTTAETSVWNARADAYAKAATRVGQTVPEITAELCRSGYAASKAEVTASLDRQGVHTLQWTAVELPPTSPWDDWADAFALAAHHIRQSRPQILAGLRRAGYGATVQLVEYSLYKQGVRWL